MPQTINEKYQRFFIALIPPEPVFSEIEEFKNYIFKKYGCKASLRSPAHITIFRPFVWKTEKREVLINLFSEFLFNPFECRLNGFGFFPKNKVVFIEPEKSTPLLALYENYSDFSSSRLNLLSEKQHDRPFHPHITIAFRDVKKAIFDELVNDFSGKTYERTFVADGLYLLEWKATRWEVLTKNPFKALG
jgi:2'-5' RNA ligase